MMNPENRHDTEALERPIDDSVQVFCYWLTLARRLSFMKNRFCSA